MITKYQQKGFRNYRGIQRSSVSKTPIQSNIVKDLGNRVSILGQSYDKKTVESKMKEVDEILKTMSLPDIKKKYNI